MDVYADVFFAVSFLMDYFVLWMAAKILRLRVLKRWLALASFVAAAIIALMLFVHAFIRLLNVAAIALVFASAVIAFRPKNLGEFTRYAVVAYICAFAVGGAGFAIYFLTGGAGFILHINPLILVVSTLFFWFLTKFIMKKYRQQLAVKRSLNMTIYWGTDRVNMEALVDTGSSLHEPISGAPVVIAEFAALQPLLPDGVKRLYEDNKQDDLAAVLEYTDKTRFAQRIRMIPFASVGNRGGVLLGFRPDRAVVYTDDGPVTITNLAIGICNFGLTSDNSFQALVGPDLLANTL